MNAQNKVWKVHPGAYAYTYGPRGWQIKMLTNENQAVVIGEGRSEFAAWQNAKQRLDAAGEKE